MPVAITKRRAWLPWVVALVAAGVLGRGAPAHAQQPVVFVHGINSSGGTWASTAATLQQQLGILPATPTLSSDAPIATQAGQLAADIQSYGFLTTPFLVGHSQGGLVSRYATGLTPANMVLTVGTPHGGAPVAVNAGWYVGVLNTMAYEVSATVFLYNVIGGDLNPYEGDEWIDFTADAVLAASVGGAFSTVINNAVSPELHGQPALTDLAPGSAFLSSLNSSANLQSEAATIGLRYGLNSQLNQGYLGGPIRLLTWLSPGDADNAGWTIINIGYALLSDAEDDFYNLDPSDPYYYEESVGLGAMADLGGTLMYWPELWCITTSNSFFCPASDAIVPASSQIYPGAVENDGIVGPSHIEEPTDPQVIGYVSTRISNAIGFIGVRPLSRQTPRTLQAAGH